MPGGEPLANSPAINTFLNGVPGNGSEGQTFLVGETVYLRPFTTADAEWSSAWRASVFPWTTARAESWLSETMQPMSEGDVVWMLAARRSDDQPIGAVWYWKWDFRAAWLSLHVRDALPTAERAGLTAELIELVVPWLLRERDNMVVWCDVQEPVQPNIVAACQQVGLRPALALRENRVVRGKREHRWLYEALHPDWVANLGDPYTAPDDPPPIGHRAPAPVQFRAPPIFQDDITGTIPPKAILVGPRVYLRALDAGDAETISYWSRRETEPGFTNGRSLRSSIAQEAMIERLVKDDPPDWIRLGICTRDDDRLIGTCGVLDIKLMHGTGETESDIFDPSRRSGGLGTEAKHLLLDFCFDHLGLHAVKSYVWSFNPRSQAALAKQGYRHSGRMHWATIRQGAFEHDDMFDLLADEWRMAKELWGR